MSTDDEYPDNPPPGFVRASNRGPYTTHNGPIYNFNDGEIWRRGFRVQKRHCNSFGLVHGGWFMSFADGLLAEAAGRGTRMPSLTIRLTCDFLSIARPGEWLEGTARCTRATRSMAFAEGEIRCGDKVIFTATGVFKTMEGHANRPARGLSEPASP